MYMYVRVGAGGHWTCCLASGSHSPAPPLLRTALQTCCCPPAAVLKQVYTQLLVEVTNGRDLREAVQAAAKDVGLDLGASWLAREAVLLDLGC